MNWVSVARREGGKQSGSWRRLKMKLEGCRVLGGIIIGRLCRRRSCLLTCQTGPVSGQASPAIYLGAQLSLAGTRALACRRVSRAAAYWSSTPRDPPRTLLSAEPYFVCRVLPLLFVIAVLAAGAIPPEASSAREALCFFALGFRSGFHLRTGIGYICTVVSMVIDSSVAEA